MTDDTVATEAAHGAQALLDAMTAWDRVDSANAMEAMIDCHLGYEPGFWDRVRAFGLDVAMTGQNMIDREKEPVDA